MIKMAGQAEQSGLFTAILSKREELYIFIKDKSYCRTSGVIRWGTQNFRNRAEVDARQLAEEGRIRRLEETEKVFRWFGNTKEEVWTIV